MKKVFALMAMFSMVAMMAACGGGKNDGDDDDANVDLKKYENQVKDFAKEACECNGDEACLETITKKMNEAFKDLNDSCKAELNKIFAQAYDECVALNTQEEVEPEPEVTEPTKATKKTTKKENTSAKKDINTGDPTLTPVNESEKKMNMREEKKLEGSKVENTGDTKRGANTGKMRK